MAKDKNWIIYAVVAVVAAYFLLPGFSGWVNGIFTPTTPVNPGNGNILGGCPTHDAITMTLGPVTKKYDQSNTYQPKTTTFDVYDRVFINGVDYGNLADGSTQTVSFGQEVCVYYAANASDFYASKACFKVPCASKFSSAVPKNDAGELATFTAGGVDSYKIVAMKNLTFAVFNQDDNLKNTAANNQSIVKNDQKTLRMNINFPSAGGIGVPGKYYLNFRVNGSTFNSVSLSGDGVAVASPSTYRAKLNASTDMVYYTFSVPGFETQNSVNKDFYVTFATANTVPAQDGSSQNISVTYDDDNWYQNSNDGTMIVGPADSNRADVGLALYSITTNYPYTIYLANNG